MNDEELTRRLDEIERALLRDDPAMNDRFRQLNPTRGWREPFVWLLLVSSVVFLAVGLASLSAGAFLVGVATFVLAFAFDHREERSSWQPEVPRRILYRDVTPSVATPPRDTHLHEWRRGP